MTSLYADPAVSSRFNTPEAHHPTLIGLSGFARSGKDSVAQIIGLLYGHKRLAFADKVREYALAVDPHVMIAQDEYYLFDGWSFRDPLVLRLSEIVRFLGWEDAKKLREVRKTLQNVGNSAREVLGEKVWIYATLNETQVDLKRYVISDVRYKNEAREILHMGGKVLRINRPGVGPANDHISENDLNDWAFDGYIENDGSLLDLQGSVMIALGDLG